MRKYIHIYKSELMSTLQYMLNILFRLINFILLIFIFMNLWNYIYDNPDELINGYSKTQMIWYVIITEIIWGATDGRRYCRRISDDVRGGNIAYMVNKPYSYIGYVFTTYLAEGFIRLIVMVPVSLIFGILFVGPLQDFNFKFIGFMIISFIIGYSLNGLIQILISLFAFFMEDATPMHWLYNKIVLIFGVFFPIDMMPRVLQGILKYTPAYVVSYGPTKLAVDFDLMNAIKIIGAQSIYLIIVNGG